ncbi:DNA repair protein RecO [Candidatus Woesebacteria bacterium RIFCSPHIGHO2_12_FULL_46_16]|uniref:DNA repair protein RecO n=1 Tax=Candidatus Woesebacteria bacterium RIFCSPHIGHO2_12_FULL_46_16 TaxID=1802513 RepID=A0A1F8AVN7_9BACT|nr:MAG: DNA repair protein RecO [Candidatus Woesebacteria bacterium RIFCSPHIGHO2_12_FULL_46_16]
MRTRNYSSEGIVLARKNFGEADRILVLYSKHHGRISLLAKGVRRPTSRKRGHLEVFSYIRFQAARGKGMDIMTEAETIDNFSKIRENLKRASLAYYFMEVVGRTTHENETHREVFEYVLESMERLKEEKQLKKFRLGFVRRLVSLLGFWPEGKLLLDPDGFLEGVIERKLVTSRVGKRVLA